MPKHPFIIWASTRTGSTALCKALGGDDEPFLPGPHNYCQAWRYDKWRRTHNPALLDNYCASFHSLKHIPDTFDDDFNIALARATTQHGYRHVHLSRLNEIARLISDDVAGQLNVWKPSNPHAAYNSVLAGQRTLNLLDVPRLVAAHHHATSKWRAIEPHVGTCQRLHTEKLTSPLFSVRHAILTRLLQFLEISSVNLQHIDSTIIAGNQNTERIYGFLQNTDELRNALWKEGIT